MTQPRRFLSVEAQHGSNLERGQRKAARVCAWPLSDEAWRLAWVLGPALVAVVLVLAFGPVRQPEALHRYHDAREMLGLPNFLNVISNLPFVLVGALGLGWLASVHAELPRRLMLCYGVMFVGIGLTAAGSAFYHWAPDNNTLLWDRLPMVLAFMGLLSGLLTERLRLDDTKSFGLLWGLVAFGVASVIYWWLSDDLGVYVLTQLYPIVAIPVILWLTPAPYTRGSDWLVAVLLYVVAKGLEVADGPVFELGAMVSGHTLKHLVAAAGGWWVLHMLVRRRPIRDGDVR